jgi:hypothetical protein
MLHVALTLDRCSDVLVKLIPHQLPERIRLGEAQRETFAMLMGAAGRVGGDPGMDRAVGTSEPQRRSRPSTTAVSYCEAR